jgi:hypothetical protein
MQCKGTGPILLLNVHKGLVTNIKGFLKFLYDDKNDKTMALYKCTD